MGNQLLRRVQCINMMWSFDFEYHECMEKDFDRDDTYHVKAAPYLRTFLASKPERQKATSTDEPPNLLSEISRVETVHLLASR